MASQRISDLTNFTAPLTTDIFPIVDLTANATKKVTLANLITAMAAVQATQETSTSTALFVTPGVQQFHPSACKFWTRCGVAGDNVGSYNVTSIGDTTTGVMTVTIATDFSSASWAPVAQGISNGRTVTVAAVQWVSATMAAGTVEITNMDGSATPVVEDPAIGYSVAGYGDQ